MAYEGGDARPVDAGAVPSLALHDPRRRLPAHRLRALLATVRDDELPDDYGQGGPVTRLEQRVADLLDKPAGVWMPTGAMAGQVALRIHADARTTRTVAFHPRAHVEVRELKGYAVVHSLVGRLLGDHDRLFGLADLAAVREPLAAVLWELPQRDLGGLLPEWDDLVAQTDWARRAGAATHLDGARLWEAQPYYARSHAEIAGLFDTVYVSLYKSLAGLGGALLAGPEPLVEHAREWQTRLGGRLHAVWPMALSAEAGLDAQLPRMADHWARARDLAEALRHVAGVTVVPRPPQTPLFHVHVAAPQGALDAAHAELVAAGGLTLYLYSRTAGAPGRSRFEVTVGEQAMALPVGQVRDAVDRLARRAQQLADPFSGRSG